MTEVDQLDYWRIRSAFGSIHPAGPRGGCSYARTSFKYSQRPIGTHSEPIAADAVGQSQDQLELSAVSLNDASTVFKARPVGIRQ